MSILFGYIQRFVLSKGGSTLVGILAACTLIWFVGPRLGLRTVSSRLTVIGIIVALTIVYFIIKLIITKRKAGQFASDLQATDDKAAQREAELDDMKGKMSEVISSLKSSELGFNKKGNAALYALPWYMVIGPPAAGKSTMLRNSGLHFPYNRQEDLDVKGFGGTRNCDWWFSDDAVLLDTAGRYTTETDDNEEWLAFLQLLKKHRNETPINGVVVALSIVDILTQDGLALETHVNIVRERIEELIKHLGITFPVYIVFTKCDLLYGFNSFYQDGTAAEQEQVWGAYLLDKNVNQNDLSKTVSDRLQELYARLCNIRTMKLSMERNFDKKAEIFDFPEQFNFAANRLEEFINLLFKENPYQDTPKFYGFYFTSGAQEGTSIQRIVGDLHQSFGFVEDVPHETEGAYELENEAPKSFFINKLFKDVIFKSKHDIDKNKSQFKTGNWLKRLWVTSALLTITASFLLLSGSLTTNTLLLNNGKNSALTLNKDLRTSNLSPEKIYYGLRGVYRQYTAITLYEESLPLHLRLGIYRADQQKLPLKNIIFDGIEVSLTRHMLGVLEYRMNSLSTNWAKYSEKQKIKYREDMYQYLRTYLMLVFRDWVDVDQAAPVITKIWIHEINRFIKNDSERLREDDEKEIISIVKLYLASLKGNEFKRPVTVNANARIVQLTRSKLKLVPTAFRLYARIKGLADFKYKMLGIDKLLLNNKEHVLESEVKLPGMFTAKAWKEFVHPQIKDIVILAHKGDWVLDADLSTQLMTTKKVARKAPKIDDRKTEVLRRRIRKLYFDDYARHWVDFIRSLRIREFISINDATTKMAALIDDEGPLNEIGSLLTKNIKLVDYDYKAPMLKTPKVIDANKLNGVKPAINNASKKPKQRMVKELDNALKGLRKALATDGKKPAELVSKYIKALSSIRDDLEKISASSDPGRDAKKYAATLLADSSNNTALYKGWVETRSNLKRQSFNAQEALKELMFSPIRSSWKVLLVEARKGLEADWHQKVEATYKSTIQGRFPFSIRGTDSSIKDVEEFFRPESGVYWSFVEKELKPFLKRNGRTWTSTSWMGHGIGISQELINNIRAADDVTISLFSKGKDRMGMTFHILPIPKSGIQQAAIFFNGQDYKYYNTPPRWKKFEWPGDANSPGARVLAVADRSQYRFEVRRDGVWGFFHLLKDARIRREQGTEYRASWRLTSRQDAAYVTWKLKAASHNNMFNLGKFTSFRMPNYLFQTGKANKGGIQASKGSKSSGSRKISSYNVNRNNGRPRSVPNHGSRPIRTDQLGQRLNINDPNFRWIDSGGSRRFMRPSRPMRSTRPVRSGGRSGGSGWVIPRDYNMRSSNQRPSNYRHNSPGSFRPRVYGRPPSVDLRRPNTGFQRPKFEVRKPKYNDYIKLPPKRREIQVFDGRNPGGGIRW